MTTVETYVSNSIDEEPEQTLIIKEPGPNTNPNFSVLSHH